MVCLAALLRDSSAVTNHVSSSVQFSSNEDISFVNTASFYDNNVSTSANIDGALGNYWGLTWPSPVTINTVVLNVGQNTATSSFNEMFKVDIWAGSDPDFTQNTLC